MSDDKQMSVSKGLRYRFGQAVDYAFKLVSSNTTTIVTTSIFLGLGVATGGASVIAIGASILALKVAKTVVDAVQAVKIRDLDTEHDALIKHVTAKSYTKTILQLMPEFRGSEVKSTLGEKDKTKLSNNKEVGFNKKTDLAQSVLASVIKVVDLAIPNNPISQIRLAKAVVSGVKNVKDIPKVASKVKADYKANSLFKTQDARAEKLAKLINLDRKQSDVSYDNIQDLQEQTRKIEICNKAIEAIMQNKDFYTKTTKQVEEQITQIVKEFDKEVAKVQKPLGGVRKVLYGIQDALNPYSEYGALADYEIREHSGMSKAIRSGYKIGDVRKGAGCSDGVAVDDIAVDLLKQDDLPAKKTISVFGQAKRAVSGIKDSMVSGFSTLFGSSEEKSFGDAVGKDAEIIYDKKKEISRAKTTDDLKNLGGDRKSIYLSEEKDIFSRDRKACEAKIEASTSSSKVQKIDKIAGLKGQLEIMHDELSDVLVSKDSNTPKSMPLNSKKNHHSFSLKRKKSSFQH